VRSARTLVEDDYWGNTRATIELVDSLSPEALQGLQEFSHVEVIFVFNQVDVAKIVTGARHPRNNESWPSIGIFAQRGKNRPNRLGSTISRVVSIEGRTLVVAELDAIDGTPVVDLKPVMIEFLPRTDVTQPAWSSELMKQYWNEGGS
jgi:tRNA (adenine37-N6)-methyltransferase